MSWYCTYDTSRPTRGTSMPPGNCFHFGLIFRVIGWSSAPVAQSKLTFCKFNLVSVGGREGESAFVFKRNEHPFATRSVPVTHASYRT